MLCRTVEDTYTFSDGTSFTKDTGSYGSSNITWTADFTSWKANQPAASSTTRENQDCVKSDKDGIWDDVVCGSARHYACQIPAGATPAGWFLTNSMISNLKHRAFQLLRPVRVTGPSVATSATSLSSQKLSTTLMLKRPALLMAVCWRLPRRN